MTVACVAGGGAVWQRRRHVGSTRSGFVVPVRRLEACVRVFCYWVIQKKKP
jgi:hypothetical protein